MTSAQAQHAPDVPEQSREAAGMHLRRPDLHLLNPHSASRVAESLDPAHTDVGVWRGLVSDGTYRRPVRPSYVVYQLDTGEHRQTGILTEIALDSYRTGRVRRHEATAPDRVSTLESCLDRAQVQLLPVTLSFRGQGGLRTSVNDIARTRPDLRLTTEDGTIQSAWIITDTELTHTLDHELDQLRTLYIADGHHRMAAAEQYANRVGTSDGTHPADFVLGALFPCDEMRVLGYHRCLVRPSGPSTAQLLELLETLPVCQQVQPCGMTESITPASGSVSMFLDGQWYRILLQDHRGLADARASLDAVKLDEEILGALFGVSDVGSDPRVTPMPGTTDSTSIARRCRERGEVGFMLHPPAVEEITAISDAGEVMPPKSTWFHPKAASGPFLRFLSASASG